MNKFLSRIIRSNPIGQLFNLGGKTAAWKKVRELKAGMKIAVANSSGYSHERPEGVEWDEIVSVRKLAPERVWDIEVEGTHNFVAGHYVDQLTGKALTAKDEQAIGKLMAEGAAEYDKYHDKSDNHQSGDNFGFSDQLVDSFKSHDILSSLIAKYKYIIDNNTLYVNSNKFGDKGIVKKYPAARLTRKPAKTLKSEELAEAMAIDFINHRLADLGATVKAEDLKHVYFGGIVAHNTSGILMRAGASSLQLSSSATSTTADIELAAADQMDLFAGRFSLTTSSSTAGDVKIDSAGTLTLSTSRNNTNVALLSGSGAFNVTAGTTTQTYSGNNQNAILLQASNGGIQLSTGSVGNGSLRLLSSGSLTIETSQNNTNISILPGSGGVALGVSTPHGSATLDLSSTSKGLLPPRMTTTQRDNISSPTKGLIVMNDSTNQLNIYNGSSWVPVGAGGGSCNSSSDCIVVLTPEYPNTIISADGSNNIGTVTSDLTISASNYYYNYYEFSSGQASLQDYDVYVSWQLPSGWADWDDAANAISIDLATEDASSANTKVDATIYRQSDADSYSETANVSPTGGEWRTTLESKSVLDITKTNLNTIATWAAGDVMVIKLKLYSKDNYYSRIGNIRIIYENQ